MLPPPFLCAFDYSTHSLGCQHLNCTNLSSRSELAAGPFCKKKYRLVMIERMNEFTEQRMDLES